MEAHQVLLQRVVAPGHDTQHASYLPLQDTFGHPAHLGVVDTAADQRDYGPAPQEPLLTNYGNILGRRNVWIDGNACHVQVAAWHAMTDQHIGRHIVARKCSGNTWMCPERVTNIIRHY